MDNTIPYPHCPACGTVHAGSRPGTPADCCEEQVLVQAGCTVECTHEDE